MTSRRELLRSCILPAPLVLASLVLASLVLAPFMLAEPAAAEAAVAKPAPDFTATDSNGKSFTLSALKGRTVVLEWTNHECPYTIKHYRSGNMQALQAEAAATGVVWLTVASSAPGQQGYVDAAAANRLTAERGAHPAAVLLDPKGDLGHLYEARSTPHMFVIDAQGGLAYAGAIDDKPSADPGDIAGAHNHVRAALAALAVGRRPQPAATRPYGCSIKYAPR